MSVREHSEDYDGGDLPSLRRILTSMMLKINAMEATLIALAGRTNFSDPTRQSYSTAEFADMVGRAEFTVRQWCLHGRVDAFKAAAGRGEFGEWRITHTELLRYLDEGLLPPPRRRP